MGIGLVAASCQRPGPAGDRGAAGIPFADGSYSSELANASRDPLPPATRTCPFGSEIARWLLRAVARAPVADQELVVGSNNSDEASRPAWSGPPETSTLPAVRTPAACEVRALARSGPCDHSFLAGAERTVGRRTVGPSAPRPPSDSHPPPATAAGAHRALAGPIGRPPSH